MHAAGQKAERVLPIDDASKVTLGVAFLVMPANCRERRELESMENFVPLCRNNDFRRIYARGKSYVTPVVVVYVMKNRSRELRLGITTSKKIGNAVQRNRSRRVIREAFRQVSPRVRRGYDLVLVARGKTPFVKSTQVQKHLERELSGAGLLIPEPASGEAKA